MNVHLYIATVPEARAAAALPRYRASLSDEERARHARMRPDPRGDEFLVGRALIRHALSIHAPGQHPWSLAPGSHGRLALVGLAQQPPLSFNLAHSAGLVVVAAAEGADVGVDVEKVDAARADDAEWDHYFAPAEVAALVALPPEDRCERFFTYWTLKESYVKARGLGLSIPLQHFWFSIARGRPLAIAFAPELDDDPARWQFAQHRLPDDYLIAVAAASGEQPITLSIARGLP